MRKKPKASRNTKMMWIWISIMMIFISELLFYTWCRVQSVQLGYAISHLTQIHHKRMTIKNNLKIEYARLKSPNRIVHIAKNKLGLMMPTSKDIIIIP